MKRLLIIAGIAIIIGCQNQPSSKSIADTTDTAITAPPAVTSSPVEPAPEENKSNWQYEEDVDKMDNTKKKFASLAADNTLTFDFPYGESSFKLVARRAKGTTDLFINCSSCQFITGIVDDKSYRIKFDDERPFRVIVNGSSSGGADVAFLESTQKLLNKMKTAKKMTIEPEFYNSGYKVITFSVKGFQWK